MRHVILLVLLPTVLAAADGTAVFEAETALGGDARAVAADGASKGRAAAQDTAWNPLCALDTAGWPKQVTVWVRHRRGPVCVKAVPETGGQREVGWSWHGGDDWQWGRIGPVALADLAPRLLVIRGDHSGRDTELDTVVVDGTGRWKP